MKYWIAGQIMMADAEGNAQGSFVMGQGVETPNPITEFEQIMMISVDLAAKVADAAKKPREQVGFVIMSITKLEEPSLILARNIN
jgi:hypothetical protein